MRGVNAAAAIAIVFFSVVLAGFIGARVDQATIALLGGVFIGLVVCVPATALVVIVAMRRREEDRWPTQQPTAAPQPTPSQAAAPTQTPAPTPAAPVINVNLNVVFVRPGANRAEKIEALMASGYTFESARRALVDGTARVLELPEPK